MDLQPSNSLLRLLPARASAVELGIEKLMSLESVRAWSNDELIQLRVWEVKLSTLHLLTSGNPEYLHFVPPNNLEDIYKGVGMVSQISKQRPGN